MCRKGFKGYFLLLGHICRDTLTFSYVEFVVLLETVLLNLVLIYKSKENHLMILENRFCEQIIQMTKPAATKITHEANKNTQYEYLRLLHDNIW